ncbi:MAG: hypothetical protein IPQ10_10205 [Saprospiraceae bacterium]|jgi:hypothetical protein|nr:hypothetical protein [Saprospiraceae bacterium]MBK7794772.1 hypothetical protein [Saprospiraceae bacterium]MBK8153216.1 hypothetical protein [Saprospiraceae bacterium]MBK9377153.1 hypothetical protein [Saprospiraceae bacterium]MBL0261413.1 hypothetical protein [Saprospiraceae bacterium]
MKTITFYIFCFSLLSIDLFSQCPMCKMAAESNLKGGGMAGQGLNTGILYLLALPYIAVGVMIYLYRKNRKELEKSGQNT